MYGFATKMMEQHDHDNPVKSFIRLWDVQGAAGFKGDLPRVGGGVNLVEKQVHRQDIWYQIDVVVEDPTIADIKKLIDILQGFVRGRPDRNTGIQFLNIPAIGL